MIMNLTPDTIAKNLPELNITQVKALQRLVLQVRLDEYDEMRMAGWLELTGEKADWVAIREKHIIRKMTEL